MNRRRNLHRSLTDSRIYQKRLRFYLFAAEAIAHPDTGKRAKWHSLCPVSEGEKKARAEAQRIIDYNTQSGDTGDMPRRIREWMGKVLAHRAKSAPSDPARLKTFKTRNRDLHNQGEAIAAAFAEFNVQDVQPVDVAQFVDQWEGQRMAQVYRGHLSKFFQWCCRKGFRADNPAREVETEKPVARSVYITDEQFSSVRTALLVGDDGKPTPSGPMVQCYVDLCYLLYQRTTDIRLLRWNQITPEGIRFTPTKTEASSGASVIVPLTPAISEVLARAKAAARISSVYVVCTQRGQPYTAHGLGSAWSRACKRAEIEGVTLKDIRPKALTDAKRAGYEMQQIAVGAAHTDVATTEGYIRIRETPISEIALRLPGRKKAEN